MRKNFIFINSVNSVYSVNFCMSFVWILCEILLKKCWHKYIYLFIKHHLKMIQFPGVLYMNKTQMYKADILQNLAEIADFMCCDLFCLLCHEWMFVKNKIYMLGLCWKRLHIILKERIEFSLKFHEEMWSALKWKNT